MDFIDSQNRWIPSIGEAKAKGAVFSLEKEVSFVENGAGQEKVASCDSRVPFSFQSGFHINFQHGAQVRKRVSIM